MRKAAVVSIVMLALGLGGCGVLDAIFGVGADGERSPDGGPAGTVGTILNYFIPGSAAIVGAIGGLYGGLRRAKGWKDAFHATASVVEGWKDPEAKKDLAAAHSAAGVTELIQPVLREVEKETS